MARLYGGAGGAGSVLGAGLGDTPQVARWSDPNTIFGNDDFRYNNTGGWSTNQLSIGDPNFVFTFVNKLNFGQGNVANCYGDVWLFGGNNTGTGGNWGGGDFIVGGGNTAIADGNGGYGILVTIGTNNIVAPHDVFAFGTSNVIYAPFSIAVGESNYISAYAYDSKHNGAFGKSNTIADNSHKNFLFGEGNYVTAGSDYNIISGYQNFVNALSYNALFGKSNWSQNSGYNIMAGEANFIGGGWSAVFGKNNSNGDSTCDYFLAAGEGNNYKGSHLFIGGRLNTVYGVADIVAGDSNFLQAGGAYNAVFGHSNTLNGNNGADLVTGEGMIMAVGTAWNSAHGHDTTIDGMLNLVVAQNSSVTGNGNAVVADAVGVTGSHNAVFGRLHALTNGMGNLVSGGVNVANVLIVANENAVFGESNALVTSDYNGVFGGGTANLEGNGLTASEHNLVSGKNNILNTSNYNIVTGQDNSLTSGGHNAIFGYGHVITSELNLVAGGGNTPGWGHVVSNAGNLVSGRSNTVSSLWGMAVGWQNTLNGQSCFAIGEGNNAWIAYGGVLGYQMTTSGGGVSHAFGIGGRDDITASNTFIVGNYGQAFNQFALTQAGGYFSSQGERGTAQIERLIRIATTSDNTPTEVLVSGGAPEIITSDNKAYLCEVKVVAKNTAAQETAGYILQFVFDRGSGVGTCRISSITKNVLHEDVVAWDVTANADIVNGRPAIFVTGENGKTINWTANIEMTEVA